MPPNTHSSLNSCTVEKDCRDQSLSACKSEIVMNSPQRLSDQGMNKSQLDVMESKSIPVDSSVRTQNNAHSLSAYPSDAYAYGYSYPSQLPPQYTMSPYYASSPYTSYNIPTNNNPWGSYPQLPPGVVGGGGSSFVTNTIQILFSIQSVLFSLGQVVQIIGSNTIAMDHLYHQCNTLFRSWLGKIQHITSQPQWSLESTKDSSPNTSLCRNDDTEKTRRKMKAIRYGLMLGASFIGCRWIHSWWKKRSEYLRYLQYYQEMASKVKNTPV